MKPNELMVNDWVYSDVLKQPYQIGRPSDFRFMYTKAYDVFDEDGHFIHIKPIPLTEEILKANGFEIGEKDRILKGWSDNKHKQYDFWCNSRGECGFDIATTTAENEYGSVYTADFANIRHVHELQHALRLCGLNDLADKLKIEEQCSSTS